MTESLTCAKIQGTGDFYELINSNYLNDLPNYKIGRFMGKKPSHVPRIHFRAAYNHEAIFINFTVSDQYVLAKAGKYQGEVWKDSCAEFFFTPGTDTGRGYFNLEINCIGTALFCHQKSRGVEVRPVSEQDFKQIEIISSLKGPIEEEIPHPVNWSVAVKLPYAILENYATLTKPEPDVIWKGNFYKCADASSHPHWLTWSKIDRPEPDFHRPEFFGTIKFE